MNAKRRWAAALVRLYPARWRREYGAEFIELLAARPMGARSTLDVVWNALRQQARLGEPWLVIGIPLLAWNLFQFGMLILYPPPYQRDSFTAGWPAAAFSILLLATSGFWTVVRNGPAASGARAAFKTLLLINWPISLIAVLAASGLLRILAVGPGDPVTTFHQHGFAITFYDHARRPPAIAGLFVLPLLSLPEALLYGWLGGVAARHLPRLRRLFHR